MARTRVYDKYRQLMSKLGDISHTIAVLSWDKEVNLPIKSHQRRSQQMATLSGIAHEEFTSKETGLLLERLINMKSLSKKEKKNVSLTYESYQRATLFSKDFVIKKSLAISNAFHAWEKARQANDFNLYIEPLDHLIQLVKEEAKKLNKTGHPYNALLHLYEPNLTVETLDEIFDQVKSELLPFIKKIRKGDKINDKFLRKNYDKNLQWQFGLDLLKNMGYDFDKGRQDISTHPFTISFSSDDVRVTTRIDENDFSNMTWSCIHEGGHALYEQGLNSEDYGLPTGGAISLGIHESQSRLWENNVGRSKSYWTYHYPKLQSVFPENLRKIDLDQFYKGINKIKPNLIRTEADELHYHLHVLIRYEIEKAIFEDKVETKDLAKLWNKKYKEYLKLEVPDDLNGILQDVHWSHGSFGYFPTYSIGSFYAAQLYAQAKKEIPKLNKQISKGDSSSLLKWLGEKVHTHGRLYEAEELCEMITGEPLNIKHFIKYVKKKYNKIYPNSIA